MSSPPTDSAVTVTESRSPPGSPSNPTAPASPVLSPLPPSTALASPSAASLSIPQTSVLNVGATPGADELHGGSLTPLSSGVPATSGGTLGTAATSSANANVLNNGVPTGYGYGVGMDPYGMGGIYGGYSGLGMGGMYGGLGMMGMGGMGMYGMGMTPETQRAQMMIFMTNRIMELWGMFSQVMQVTLGSAVQFVGEYVGINQRLGQLEEDSLNNEERYMSRKYELRKALSDIPREQRYVPKRSRVRKPKQPSFLRRLISRFLYHVVLLAAAYLLSKRISSWLTVRSGRKLLETTASKGFSSSTTTKMSF
ncbi:hypothetical protein JKF63_01492 [Porcisia hertigi]|uniref:Peroxin-13 n=1 Tax=Porcisia hertigi TaxID=2761500 RepID=A0A836H3C9_9TRYP|nr:hypothetical protein JKF63_01492 [Porcisia hertigi]